MILVQFYVDDIIFGSTNDDLCKRFAKLMQSKFEMSMMGELKFFLGLQVSQRSNGIFICQSKYLKELLKKYHMEDSASVRTPSSTAIKLGASDNSIKVDVTSYRGMIGSLLYLTASRPDIMFSEFLLKIFCIFFEDLKMADRSAQRLQKMNQVSKRGITIRSSTMSLQDMILERSEEYPSVSHLDSYNHSNRFHDADKIADYKNMYKIRPPYRLVPAGPGDRSCHWRPNALCIYKGVLAAGVRFPFHPFIPQLLADVGINPCQLPPNAWRLIMCFIVLCLKNKFPLSVALFRKIFQFKNSSSNTLGWVYISHRSSTPPIFHPKSIPDNNPKWKDEFMYLMWDEGDWGTLFQSSFSRVSDGSPDDIILTEEEAHAYAKLIKDDYATKAWELLDEFVLKSLKLSKFLIRNEPESGETARIKRACLKDPRLAAKGPSILRPHVAEVEEVEGSSLVKSSVWRPNWGIRKKDTIVGVAQHAVEWSHHSLTPCDYKDFVANSTIEGAESAGSQAFAAANASFQGALFQAKAWCASSEANKAKFDKAQLEVGSLRTSLNQREKELLDAQAELVELRKGKDRIIDEYFDSAEYQEIITQHDDLLFPVHPHAPNQLEKALAGEGDMDEDDRILNPEHASQPGEESEGSSSGEEESGEEEEESGEEESGEEEEDSGEEESGGDGAQP
ncbi:hypothetical protein POM88_053472 [Heracleum sosnowskyi]|uniref:Reverse transcriptase Ty1/copia-type domain-containing protein n=1 Tax=Heracleum sosnowskyi TaxID=360622 RepID=A0AAD8GPF6_9APIA|nr:hypothetical protein POM88_053472 [Heracleum sosnowskyi]